MARAYNQSDILLLQGVPFTLQEVGTLDVLEAVCFSVVHPALSLESGTFEGLLVGEGVHSDLIGFAHSMGNAHRVVRSL